MSLSSNSKFRYTNYADGHVLLGCVGRYDIVLNRAIPGNGFHPDSNGRIIADFDMHDDIFFILRKHYGAPLRVSRPKDISTRYELPTKEERQVMRNIIRLFEPRA